MKPESTGTQCRMRRSRVVAGALAWILAVTTFTAAQSVEKAETAQQSRQPEETLAMARAVVSQPDTAGSPPETGKILGNYAVTSALEVGYRFVDSRGNRDRYLSDVNVRDGPRVLDYVLDAHSAAGKGVLFDFLRADVSNAGGDQSQHMSLRADKARMYKLDATVRRFNYFRAIPAYALNQHNFDLRQQMSDFDVTLLPQRVVRFNLGYSRSMAKGPFGTTYDVERDEFPILGSARWESNDYRMGFDVHVGGWDFFAEQMLRRFKNDTEYTQSGSRNVGNQTGNTSVLTFFERDSPERSRAQVTRASLRGSLGPRVHLIARGLYGRETLEVRLLESTLGTDANNRQILSRSLTTPARVRRPNTSLDADLTVEATDWLSFSESGRFSDFRINGDLRSTDESLRQPTTGGPVVVSSVALDHRFTNLSSYWNTLQAHFKRGVKLSGNVGWRATRRTARLGGLALAEEAQVQRSHAVIAGFRVRPNERVTFFVDSETGTSDNVFVRVSPMEFTRFRLRATVEPSSTLNIHTSFTTTDRTNPTRFVENNLDARSLSVTAFWLPSARASLTGGYGYDYIASQADIAFFRSSVLTRGRSRYFARQHSVFMDSRWSLTSRLDLLLGYRFGNDRGPESIRDSGPNDFVTALPLHRHNPEVRLAYRFSNHATGNLTYRHYSYNERDFSIQDYRAHILTTSFRWTL